MSPLNFVAVSRFGFLRWQTPSGYVACDFRIESLPLREASCLMPPQYAAAEYDSVRKRLQCLISTVKRDIALQRSWVRIPSSPPDSLEPKTVALGS